jgi:acyl-CoA dehydrogenase
MSPGSMDKINQMAENAAPIEGTMKFNIGDNSYYIDGTGDKNVISTQDADADCTISVSEENFQKLISGKLNPMMAVMSGKIKIKGDMGLAMKLQGMLS